MQNIVPDSLPKKKATPAAFSNAISAQLGTVAVFNNTLMQAAAVKYVEDAGFALVCAPPMAKGPTNKGWNTQDNVIHTAAKAIHINGNIGIAHAFCRSGPTCAIDLDQMDKANDWLRQHGVELDDLMQTVDAVLVESGKPNSAKLLYRLPQGTPPIVTKNIKDECGGMIVEFRCATATGLTVQDILPPSIHPSGTQYRWTGRGSWRNLPELPASLFAIWKSLIEPSARPAFDNHVASNVELTEEQWADLDNAMMSMKADDYDCWIKIGHALKGTGERGRALWMKWSAACPELFDENEAASKWNSFDPIKVNYKSVFKEAQDRGWENPAKARARTNASPSTDASNGEWPEPQKLPAALKPVPTFDVSVLPDSIHAWAVDCAYRFQAPIEYFIMPLLATAGIILGNKVGIQPKQNDTAWVVFPILWGAVVGSPGSLKTPTLNEALKPIRHLEGEARKVYSAEKAKYDQDYARYQQLTSGKKANANAAAPLPTPPQEPVMKRYSVNDTTYQKLGEILEQNPNGVIAISDELTGLLLSLNAQGQEAARGFFLAGWGGNSSYSFDRVGRGTVMLGRFALSVFGGFQPEKIQAYVRAASAGSSDNDGLLQRFQLLAWPDEQEEWQFVDQAPDTAAERAMHAAILALENVAKHGMPSADRRPDGTVIFRFSSDAQDFFNQWYQTNERFVRNENLDLAQCSHFAKYRSLVPALALLFHLLDGHEGAVCMACMKRAVGMALILKKHADRVYGSVYGGDYASARALAKRLIKQALQDGFTVRDVYAKGWSGLKDREAVQRAITALVEHGWLVEHASNTGGRPTSRYSINPSIGQNLL